MAAVGGAMPEQQFHLHPCCRRCSLNSVNRFSLLYCTIMHFWYSLSPNLPADLTAKAKVIFDDLVDEDIVV